MTDYKMAMKILLKNDFDAVDFSYARLPAIEAVEKQIPKKPLYKQGTKYKWIDSVREHGRYHSVEKYSNRDACPNCKKDVLKTPYCEYCGQALDWSEEK